MIFDISFNVIFNVSLYVTYYWIYTFLLAMFRFLAQEATVSIKSSDILLYESDEYLPNTKQVSDHLLNTKQVRIYSSV